MNNESEMNRLNIVFKLYILIGLLFIILAIQTKHPLLVALTGYLTCILSTVGHALNRGK